MNTSGQDAAGRLVKCVVWDLDNTLLAGTYLESPQAPPGADPVMAKVLATLAARGILHAIASKNPPQAAAHAARVTGGEFAAVECGWDAKPQALARIAAGLGIGTGALAFVDDDPYERAEVAAALPQVLVLSPEDAAGAVDWPEFSPPVITEEARRRGALYAARRSRQEAERAFAGSREEFLAFAATTITIAAAAPGEAARLHELAVRTQQFNSGAPVLSAQEFTRLATHPGHQVISVRLRDVFGDDGIVGACVVERRPGCWWVSPLMMSCRAMGRGVIGALLAWLARAAAGQGGGWLKVPCVLTERNVPLRLALAGAGFRAAAAREGAPAAGVQAVYCLDLAGPLPGLPEGVNAP
jgi:methoxymalonate biosynthesis protein